MSRTTSAMHRAIPRYLAPRLREALADCLAGRMGMLRLHALAQCELAGKRFTKVIVLYDDEISASFGDGFYAVPIRRRLEAV